MRLSELIEKEGWSIVEDAGERKILAYGNLYPLVHPFSIHSKLYRTAKNPETKYLHMKAMHDYLWPDTIWHYWTERRFRAHCEGYNYITYAGGAATTKSYDAAKIALLFWLGNPERRAVIVASTSLESVTSRIWGYITKLINSAKVAIPYKYTAGNSPKILYPPKKKGKKIKDTIHGMFAVAAKRGDDENVISSWIGRHPDEAIMVILDEATDMPPALAKSIPNLERGVEFFQCMAIGNSSSIYDLHGALSTPKDGWKSVSPERDVMWPTTQNNGVCLFFSCYESPAIFETDPERKALLSKFLITKELIELKLKEYGGASDAFWRFVLGFWRSSSTDSTVISKQFITDFDIYRKTEWSGRFPLSVVAGLDPAFSTGGDQCILRLAILGVDVSGQIVLDFKDEQLLFRIPIIADMNKSAEVQIAERVLHLLRQFNCPLSHLAVDATGQGRALAEVIRLTANELKTPIKIYSTKVGSTAVNSFDVLVRSSYDMWFAFRDFIQNGQIRGMDYTAATQFTTRLIVTKNGRPSLESKIAYKNRMGAIMPSLAKSPDEADSCALVLQSAMINYGFSPGTRKSIVVDNTFVNEKMTAFREIQKVKAQEEKKQVHQLVPTFSEGNMFGMGAVKRPFN